MQAGMVIEPETLDLHFRVLRERFELAPLSHLANPAATRSGRKPRCAFTFDDGWSDFYHHAFPIVKALEVPVTVFLPTEFIGTNRWFWTDRLGHLLSGVAGIRDTRLPHRFPRAPLLEDIMRVSGTQSQRLERAIALLKPHSAETVEHVLATLSQLVAKDATPTGRAFLAWDEVREMADSGLVQFGSHTASHRLLTTLAEDEAWHELTKSKRDLLAHKAADESFIAFSYPNGNHSERLSRMVREAGYHLAVTTRPGWHMQGDNPHTIKRIALHQDISSTEATLAWRMASRL